MHGALNTFKNTDLLHINWLKFCLCLNRRPAPSDQRWINEIFFLYSSLSDPAVLAWFILTGLCVCCCAFDRPPLPFSKEHHHSIVSVSFSSDTGGGVREGGGCCPGPLAAESGGGVGAWDGVGAGRAPAVPPALTWSDCRWIGNLRLGWVIER